MNYTTARRRMNFMLNVNLVDTLQQLVPSGERSDFINEAVEKALKCLSREKAFEEGTKLRDRLNLKIGSDEELLKKIRYGRKEW